jgi:hypothetical protein
MSEFLVTTANPTEAHAFYYKQIYEDNRDLEVLCKRHNFKTRDPYNWKWELFAAILVGDKAKTADNGADLVNYEVKSRGVQLPFEYQYHSDSWPSKLEEDKKVTHLFISYSPLYMDIVVRAVTSEKLLHFFQEWEPELQLYWKEESKEKVSNRRFRKAIPYATVCEKGKIICVIDKTKLIYSDTQGIDSNLLLKPLKGNKVLPF